MSKLLIIPPIRIIIAILFVGVAIVIGQVVLNFLRSVFSITNTGVANLLSLALLTPATYFAYRTYFRLVEKRDLTELSRVNMFYEFALGSLIGFGLIGFGLFALVIAILSLLGFYRVTGVDSVGQLVIAALASAFVSAFVQELIFRTVIYRITEEWLGTWWVLAISAILFGLIHLTSPGAALFSALAIAPQAGVLLGAAYALTHRLWMALGMHMMWDFVNDGIFGVGVAGQSGEPIAGLLQVRLNGPQLFTGGIFGVEASVVALVIVLIAGIFMLWKTYQNGQFVELRPS